MILSSLAFAALAASFFFCNLLRSAASMRARFFSSLSSPGSTAGGDSAGCMPEENVVAERWCALLPALGCANEADVREPATGVLSALALCFPPPPWLCALAS